MTVYSVGKPGQSWYGEVIGIMILDAAYPCVPGNVGNASTYPYPVRYEEIIGASIERLVNQADPELSEAFIVAARNLQNRGVKAITGACGFMAQFQEEVQKAVDIPVFLSSLLQIPFIYTITRRPVGVVTANSSRLTARHFQACGISENIPVVVAGMENSPEFASAILEEKGTLDSAAIEAELLQVAQRLKDNNPNIGAVLLECSDLPPYAASLQAEIGLPVFDFTTMIDHVAASLTRRSFSGYV